jgi:serpin B
MDGRSDRSGQGDGWVAASKELMGEVSFEVVLPDEGRFDEVADRIDAVFTEFDAATNPGGRLAMPRFETRVDVALKDVLLDVGLTAPFEAGNLLGIADDPRTVLDNALHQTWLSVDESGIEAAAATVLLMVAVSEPIEQPVEVVLDRPFLFRIVDGPSTATLFVGRVMDPTG